MNWSITSAVILLMAFSIAVGQTKPAEQQSQRVGPSEVIPTFQSEARLVLVTARAWKRTADKHPDELLVSAEILNRYPPEFWEPLGIVRYAKKLDTRLMQSDFHVFDNDVEQRIDYFKKTVLPLKDVTQEEQVSWRFSPTSYGTWGYPPEYFFPTHANTSAPPGFPQPGRYMFTGPDITYVIGYVPPAFEPGKCHEVRVEVENHEVGLDRNQYCPTASSQDVDDATREGTEVGTKMRAFADSDVSGSVRVSASASAFRSSRVSHFKSSNKTGGSTATPRSELVFDLEARDFKDPARVQISVEFVSPRKGWLVNCRENPAFALHVLGIAYKVGHRIAGQFGDTATCKPPSESEKKRREILTGGSKGYDTNFPSRLDAQMNLNPGDYDVRVVVSNGDKVFGKAQIPLRVEGFDGQQLAISDLVLSSFPRDASKALDDAAVVSPAPLVPAPLISKNVQFLPDTQTRISPHMRLPLYFEIYEPFLKQQTTQVYIHLKVMKMKTNSVVLDTGLMNAASWVEAGNTVVPIGFSLGTQNLDKGDYQVEVQASDAMGRESAWRQAKFSIN